MLTEYHLRRQTKIKQTKPPSLWNFIKEIYKSMQLLFDILVSFPMYILGKLGITNILPTLLATNSILGPAMIALSQ